ncbi:MAG TPA: hypothetical protein VGL08_08265, partial [Paraburkholderia sp.]
GIDPKPFTDAIDATAGEVLAQTEGSAATRNASVADTNRAPVPTARIAADPRPPARLTGG